MFFRTHRARRLALIVTLACAPLVVAADGGGCGAKSVNVCAPLPCPSGAPWNASSCSCEAADASEVVDSSTDASNDGATQCVSNRGEACGGNVQRPCVCAAGLVCTAADSGLPFGDVGGTCQP